MRKAILIGVALVAALGTAYFVRSWSESQKRPVVVTQNVTEQAVPEVQVLVADHNLPAGTILHKDDLRWQSWPEDGVADVYVVRGKTETEDFAGAVVRQGIAQGEPITKARVVRQGERGFLAAILHPGMRAVSVPVSATTGVSGLLFPGDRVDLILTHSIDRDEGAGNKPRRASETVLRNVRLLAVDQRTNDQENTPGVAKNVTLEVSPKQAEAISMLTDMGRLSLSLRSLAKDSEDSEEKVSRRRASYTLDNQVSSLLRPPASVTKPRRQSVSVVRGSVIESITFNGSKPPERQVFVQPEAVTAVPTPTPTSPVKPPLTLTPTPEAED